MGRSISIAGPQQPGRFLHALSETQFTILPDGTQKSERKGFATTMRPEYVVGSGSHAFGYLVLLGNHLFQSPLSYYTSRQQWDMAPGYENTKDPDFSRPVTNECLSCHADQPQPIPETLNSYQTPPLLGAGIQCDRCHGSAEAHLHNPVPGSIVNPDKLAASARDSVCEQCHLTGEIRIPNAGKAIPDFRPGSPLEETYTVYVARHDPEKQVKVVSQAEQLALSRCARESAGRLWCGSCHDPHQPLVRSAAYYRDKCLGCHAQTLAASHAAPTQNCIECHMASLPAKDGGHTAFTDHRISRRPADGLQNPAATTTGALIAWREPDAAVRDRNYALALVTAGMDAGDSAEVIRGYKMLNRMGSEISKDAAALTALGTILLTAKQPAEARTRFERALALRPTYAPYEVNLASALMEEAKLAEGTRHLERAVQLDPLLKQAVVLLRRAYLATNEDDKADALWKKYQAAMGIQ
jgi:Flp pilus assembly protein TadD